MFGCHLLAFPACISCLHFLLAFAACICCLHFLLAFAACISCFHFLLAFAACICCLHLLLAFAACISCLHLLLAFPAFISCLHFLLAFLLAFPSAPNFVLGVKLLAHKYKVKLDQKYQQLQKVISQISAASKSHFTNISSFKKLFHKYHVTKILGLKYYATTDIYKYSNGSRL